MEKKQRKKTLNAKCKNKQAHKIIWKRGPECKGKPIQKTCRKKELKRKTENKGKAYYFIAKRVVMGRSENCDITIADIKSSREHAEIITVGNDYILTDLGTSHRLDII